MGNRNISTRNLKKIMRSYIEDLIQYLKKMSLNSSFRSLNLTMRLQSYIIDTIKKKISSPYLIKIIFLIALRYLCHQNHKIQE